MTSYKDMLLTEDEILEVWHSNADTTTRSRLPEITQTQLEKIRSFGIRSPDSKGVLVFIPDE